MITPNDAGNVLPKTLWRNHKTKKLFRVVGKYPRPMSDNEWNVSIKEEGRNDAVEYLVPFETFETDYYHIKESCPRRASPALLALIAMASLNND